MVLSDVISGVGKALFGDKGLAGGVVDTLKSVGVIKDSEQEQKALQALRDFQSKQADQEIQLEQIFAGDRASARSMQTTALQQEDKFSKRFIYWYAIGMTTMSFAYFFCVTFIPLEDNQLRFADTILGFLLGIGLATIIAFFFGSSRGSMQKSQDLSTLLMAKGKEVIR